jgi:endonuclease-3
MNDLQIDEAFTILSRIVHQWQSPAITILSQRDKDPFKVLISCILSLRTQDKTTAGASDRLFAIADNPEKMVALSIEMVERAIYPVGFYRNKSAQILGICRILIEYYHGSVPDEIDELLKLKGVGRKTANLVVTLGFGKPGICVDTHVHRICNRWGYVNSKSPDETERALRNKLPTKYWLIINDLLVTFGQNHCHPVSPRCSNCLLANLCDRIGVNKWR